MKTLYELLEVSENASQEVIEKAYKVLVKRYHPDLQKDTNKKTAETKIKQINDAYEILSDEEKRKQYDEELEQKRQYEKQIEEEKIIEQANILRQSFVNTNNDTNNIEEEKDETQSYSHNINIPPEQLYWEKQKQAFQKEYNKEYEKIIQQYPDEKTQKKLLRKTERKLENKYLEKYDEYLRRLGYKVKTRWTFEKIRKLLIFIAIIILIGWLLWIIPPTHNMLVNFYENNRIIKSVIDTIGAVFSGTITGIIEVFKQ